MTTEQLSTGCSGFFVQALRGEICALRYGARDSVSGRFILLALFWGLWQRILEALQQQADAQGNLNWEIHHVDGSVIRAHQHAAGALMGN